MIAFSMWRHRRRGHSLRTGLSVPAFDPWARGVLCSCGKAW